MLGLTGQVESGKLAVATIADAINEGWREKWQKSTETVGRKLKALGFTKARLAGGARAIEYDVGKANRLAERYGVRLPPAKPSLPPRYESDSSDSSDGLSAPRDTADNGHHKLALDLWELVGRRPIPYEPGRTICDLDKWLPRHRDEEVLQVIEVLEAMTAPNGGTQR